MTLLIQPEPYRTLGQQNFDTYALDGLIVPSAPIQRCIMIECHNLTSEGKTLSLPHDCGFSLRLDSVFICSLTPTLGIEIAYPVGEQGEDQRIPLVPATKGGAVKLHGPIVAPGIPVTVRHTRKGEIIPYLYFIGEICMVLATLEFD